MLFIVVFLTSATVEAATNFNTRVPGAYSRFTFKEKDCSNSVFLDDVTPPSLGNLIRLNSSCPNSRGIVLSSIDNEEYALSGRVGYTPINKTIGSSKLLVPQNYWFLKTFDVDGRVYRGVSDLRGG